MTENESKTKRLRELNSISNFPIAAWGADRIEELEKAVEIGIVAYVVWHSGGGGEYASGYFREEGEAKEYAKEMGSSNGDMSHHAYAHEVRKILIK
tara:strand:+ start:33 stop:320 length:288 start_codon:yes stop_codon:yes gene_type:complete